MCTLLVFYIQYEPLKCVQYWFQHSVPITNICTLLDLTFDMISWDLYTSGSNIRYEPLKCVYYLCLSFDMNRWSVTSLVRFRGMNHWRMYTTGSNIRYELLFFVKYLFQNLVIRANNFLNLHDLNCQKKKKWNKRSRSSKSPFWRQNIAVLQIVHM